MATTSDFESWNPRDLGNDSLTATPKSKSPMDEAAFKDILSTGHMMTLQSPTADNKSPDRRPPIAHALRTELDEAWEEEQDDPKQTNAACVWCRARPPRCGTSLPSFLVEAGTVGVAELFKDTNVAGIVYSFCDVAKHRCLIEYIAHTFPHSKSDA
jgi:hypothetical protein